MINTLSKLGIEGNLHNLIKSTYKNLTANMILNDERLTASLQDQEQDKTRMLALITPVQH